MASLSGGSVVWQLDVDAAKFSKGLVDAKNEADKAASEIEKRFTNLKNAGGTFSSNFAKSLDKISTSLDSVGNSFIKFGAPAAAAMGLSIKAAVDFEDQMANVAKTVGLTKGQVDEVGAAFLELSKNTRTSIPDLVDIATIGGQIGIAKDDIVAFTEATNMATVALGDEFGSAEMTAKAIGTLGTQYGLIQRIGVDESIKRVGSALNQLGASGLATADYVSEFTNRLGGAANLLKITATDSLGLGAAIQETGLNVEASSTAIQKTLLAMSAESENFAKAMGLSGKEAKNFSELVKNDANQAFLDFLSSLASLTPEQAIDRLDDLGLSSALTAQTLLTLRDKTALVADKQAIANQAFEEGTSLMDEYNVKNTTTAAESAKLANKLRSLAVTLGDALLPSVNNLIDKVGPLVESFATFTKNNPAVVTGVLSLGSALATLGVGFKVAASFASGFSSLISAGKMVSNLGMVAQAVKGLNIAFAFLAANPIVLIIGGIALAIALLAMAWKNNWGDIQGKTKAVLSFLSTTFSSFVSAFKTIFSSISTTVQAVFQGVQSAFSNFGTTLSTLVSTVATGFKDFVLFVIQLPMRINEAFLKIPEIIAYALGFALGKIVLWGSQAWAYLSENVPIWIEGIFNFFNTLPLRLGLLLMGILMKFAEWGANLWTYLSTNVPIWVENVVTWISQLPGRIGEQLTKIYQNFMDWGASVWSYLSTEVPKWIKNVVTWISELPGKISSALSTLGTTLKESFANGYSALIAEISTWPGKLYEWGVNVVNGFVEGIKSALGKIKDAFVQGFNDAKGSIEGNSPPKEGPLKNIDRWGYNIGDAWIQGMKEAMNSFQMPDAMFSAGIEGPRDRGILQNTEGLPSSGGSAPVIYVNIGTVQNKSDIDQISREIGFRASLLPAL